jgi:hypothetical protein
MVSSVQVVELSVTVTGGGTENVAGLLTTG